MIQHYIKIAIRNFVKDKGYSVINLAGLSLALACSFMFVLWVQYENNYESTHVHRKDIYRVLTAEYVGGDWIKRNTTPGPLGQALKEEFPAIANATFLQVGSTPGVLVYNEQPYSAIGGVAGNQFFEIFTFEFIQGSPQTAFDGERPMVISEDFARKVFGSITGDIIGQQIYQPFGRVWRAALYFYLSHHSAIRVVDWYHQ